MLNLCSQPMCRLELRDEDEIKAMEAGTSALLASVAKLRSHAKLHLFEANQNVLLRRENDELRKIALAAPRFSEVC